MKSYRYRKTTCHIGKFCFRYFHVWSGWTSLSSVGVWREHAAYQLAADASVLLLERESQPGYHTTGRSAAVFTEIYGNAAIRALTVASGPFFRDPPQGFCDAPLLTSRPLIMLARQDQTDEVHQFYEQAVKLVPTVRIIDADEVIPTPAGPAQRLCIVRPPGRGSCDIDVNAVHMSFLRGQKCEARKRSARLR